MAERLIPLMIDPNERRELIRQKVVEGLKESFPVKSRNKTLELDDLRFDAKDYGPSQQKEAILRGDTLFETVKGTIRLRDKDGKVVDEVKNFTLARVPWFTPRHTLIIAGNEYSVSNQVRPKPGVYARKRANGILEANFNTRGGSNFNVSMDPAQGVPHLEYGSTKIPLYPILRKSGISHEDISQSWGKELADANQLKLAKNEEKAIDTLYKKITPAYHYDPKLSSDEKMKTVYERYTHMHMDPEVNKRTLGKAYETVTPHSLLDASGKVLRIFRNADEVDDRDNLDFKAMHSVDDFFKEIVTLNARDIARKTAIKMEANPDLRKVLPSGPFTPGLLKFVNTSQLAAVPTQTNPMELVDAAMRVTSLGEGGISTERAIPMEMRQIHATQIGAIDPFRTPESFRAGIDVRAATHARKDTKGNIYVPIYDVIKGKNDYIRAGELKSSIVAFPNQELKGTVDALVDGVVRKVSAKSVRYQIAHPSLMYSPTTNLIPFMESLRGNRAVMGSKMQTQALSLLEREEPYVQVKSPIGKSFEKIMGETFNPRAPVSGTIAKIDDEYIYIKPNKEKTAARGDNLVKVPYETFFPLASKTHLNHVLSVKPGDKVESGQTLGESNFTRNGTLALGKNMSVAYMPYYGANSNDAIVVSEGAAKKLTSERMYKIIIPRDVDTVFQKDKHQLYYGHSFTKDQYGLADTEGVVKPGATINPGDPVVFGLRKSQMTADDLLLGRLHKSLVKPYRDGSQLWDHDHSGEVIDVVKTPKRIAVTVLTREPITVGDKLSGRGGNKGVVSQIVSDDQMIRDESGKPIDIILTSAGIVSRTNPGVILETAVGKVAEKLGKPMLIENQSGKDNVKWAKELLKKHHVKDKEDVYDPVSGKTISKVFVGRQYMFKLMKSTDTNYSARGVANYDMNQQPTKGGVQSAKAIGKMEFDALIGHNARNILHDVATIKSQKNDEFWRAIQLGYPTPPPKSAFAYDKLLSMMMGAGIHVERKGNILSAAPMTDKSIKEMSSGEIKEPKMVRAKDLKPETGGLFDPAVTGGLAGKKWCFRGDTKVITNCGMLTIKEIVKNKLPIRVLSYNAETKNLEFQPILNYWENTVKEPLIKLVFDNTGLLNGYARTKGYNFLWCTAGHEVYTEEFKKIKAKDLEGKKVYAPTHVLNYVQEQLLYGSLLGDSYLTKPSTNALYNCSHGSSQYDYLLYKKNILDVFCNNDPSLGMRKAEGKFKERRVYRLRTMQHSVFTNIYTLCYPLGKRLITQDWLDKIDAMGLAFWFMDDGSAGVYNRKLHLTLCTHRYSYKEVKLLCSWLENKWGIASRIHRQKLYAEKDTDYGYAITLSPNSAVSFLEIVAPYIVPSMKYKVYFDDPSIPCRKCGKAINPNFDYCDSCILDSVSSYRSKKEYQESDSHLLDESTLRQRYGSWANTQELIKNKEMALTANVPTKFKILRELYGSKITEIVSGTTPTTLREITVDRVISEENSPFEKGYSSVTTVYNLEVAHNHNYFAGGILVGNCHIDLAEPIVSPVFKDPVRHLLGMSNPQLNAAIKERGGEYIRKELKKIDLDKREEEIRKASANKSGSTLDVAVKQLKYIRALKEQGLRPEDAYIISKVPVVPPIIRPVLPGKGGQEIIYGDINPLYRDLLYVNNQFKDVKKSKLVPGEEERMRPALQEAVGAVFGVNDPVTAKSRARGHKGFLTYIAGTTSPKYGYFQSKIMKRTQDVSGRGTIVPDNTLGLDEVGIPEEMMWTMYDKFIVRRLVQNGYPALQASQMIKDRSPIAREMLLRETKERPVIVNRAPTLHRYNMVAAYPRLAPGKTIRVHPFIEAGSNSDYDGDSSSAIILFKLENPVARSCFLENPSNLKMRADFTMDGPTNNLDTIVCAGYYTLHIRDFPRIKESKVEKDNKEIYKVPEGISVFGYDPKDQKVLLRNVTEFSVHHDLSMVMVRTLSGRMVEVSADHSLFGLNPDTGKLERFNPTEQKNWAIPRPRNITCSEGNIAKQITMDKTYVSQQNKEGEPLYAVDDTFELTEGLGWLLGAIIGDGWISYNRDKKTQPVIIEPRGQAVGIAAIDKNIQEKFVKECQNLVIGGKIKYKTYDNSHEWNGVFCESQKTHVHNAALASALGNLFDYRRGAKNKRLPTFFVNAPKEFLLGLFAGLLDTDGSISIVKAKAKKKPQIMSNYATSSIELASDVSSLALLLGIPNRITKYKGKEAYTISFSMPAMVSLASVIPCVLSRNKELLSQLTSWDFSYYLNNCKDDTIPIALNASQQFKKLYKAPHLKTRYKMSPDEIALDREHESLYATLCKAQGLGKIGRASFNRLIAELGEEKVKEIGGEEWFSNVTNPNLIWDYIEEVVPLEGKHTAWDLTVPDGNTFMTSNQLIVYDTMMVHAPVTPKAVAEAKELTLSNLLFSDKTKSDLLVFPKHEAIMGIAHASQLDEKNKPVRFKTQGEAMAAYKAGKITLGTRVIIENK
jgi:DNA-directed RNA polymerase beta subunit/DNA-directed RNA polymerase beta' subunit